MTKYIGRVIFLVILMTSWVRVVDAQPQVLTLAQAVNEALVHNDRIVNQRDNVEQAALGVRLARNNFRPKIIPNIQGSFGLTNVSNQLYRVDLTQRFTTGTEMRLGLGASTAQIPAAPFPGDIRFYNADTTMSLNQPLLKGFGPSVARRGLTTADLRQADAARQTRLMEQQVTIDVASAYYRLVAQQTLGRREKSLNGPG